MYSLGLFGVPESCSHSLKQASMYILYMYMYMLCIELLIPYCMIMSASHYVLFHQIMMTSLLWIIQLHLEVEQLMAAQRALVLISMMIVILKVTMCFKCKYLTLHPPLHLVLVVWPQS